jgi:hypothetical protein
MSFFFRKVHDRAKDCLLEGRVLENVLVWGRGVVGCGRGKLITGGATLMLEVNESRYI